MNSFTFISANSFTFISARVALVACLSFVVFARPASAQEKFDVPDASHTFRKGHRLRVQVQSSWFRLVNRNPQKFVNIYQARDSDFQKATQRIYRDGRTGSHLKLTVLP